jgi:dTDP-4-dehydrorhamnose reductase
MILLLGPRGAVARGIARGLEAEGLSPVVDETTDLASMRDVRKRISEAHPDALIISGAIEDPAEAELDPDRAFRENAENLIHSSVAALEFKTPLILLSTPEIFGQRGGPWIESDEPAPASTWARTRLQGEQFVQRAAKDLVIVRAGPVLSLDLELERSRLLAGPIEEASDEHVSPIAGSELGRAIAGLFRAGQHGVFHLAPAEEPVTRAELWQALAAQLGFAASHVVAKPGRELRRKAVLARSPALLAEKARAKLTRPIAPWRDALVGVAVSPSVAPVSRTLNLKSGARHIEPAVPTEIELRVEKGKVVVETDQEDRILKTGASIRVPAGKPLRITALEDSVLTDVR